MSDLHDDLVRWERGELDADAVEAAHPGRAAPLIALFVHLDAVRSTPIADNEVVWESLRVRLPDRHRSPVRGSGRKFARVLVSAMAALLLMGAAAAAVPPVRTQVGHAFRAVREWIKPSSELPATPGASVSAATPPPSPAASSGGVSHQDTSGEVGDGHSISGSGSGGGDGGSLGSGDSGSSVSGDSGGSVSGDSEGASSDSGSVSASDGSSSPSPSGSDNSDGGGNLDGGGFSDGSASGSSDGGPGG